MKIQVEECCLLIIDIQEKLNDNNFSNQTFYDGLDVLTFEQISYVGW